VGIDLDIVDFQLILQKDGSIKGVSKKDITIYEIYDIFDSFSKYLSSAKGVIIQIGINQDQSLFSISDVMEKYNAILKDDCDVIFGTQIVEEIKLDRYNFMLVISGIGK
jgi:hypothetical protein